MIFKKITDILQIDLSFC